MSGGRLIILPKKSYCPWKPENVERVLRDERLEQERWQADDLSKAGNRLDVMRKSNDEAETGEENQEHINLFKAEEKEFLNGLMPRRKEYQKVGIMPVSLGQSELKSRGQNTPFYLRDSEDLEKLTSKEIKRKNDMDPMKEYLREHESSEEERGDSANKRRKKKNKKRHRKERTVHSDDASECKKRKKRKRRSSLRKGRSETRSRERPTPDLEALRQRRLERESAEAQREAALHCPHQQNDKKRHYQNQYNPSLSRT